MKSQWTLRACYFGASLLLVACGKGEDPDDTSSLRGMWDVIASFRGQESYEFTVNIDSQRIEVVVGSDTFGLRRDGDGLAATYIVSPKIQQVAITRTATDSMALGVFPLDLGGSWSARNQNTPDDSFGCDGTFSASAVSANCTGTRFPNWMDGYNPGSGTATGNKETSAASIFGDLGGVWRISSSKGTSCTFRFEGSTFSSDCGAALGGATVTFSIPTASGSTTSGYEFSARRR